jgi:soluble lytic murein transglycosylase-like protein
MRTRLQIALMATSLAATFLSSTSNVRAQTGGTNLQGSNISVSDVDGRRVFTNDGPAQKPRMTRYEAPAQQQRLMFWSSTEHRFKPVPHARLRDVRSAAAEVNQFMATRQSEGNSATAAVPSSGGFVRGAFANAREIDEAIEQSARRHNVDPNLVRALVKVESNFNPNAVSRKGAMGLMQLMPFTARQLNVTNPFDPQQNVDAGVRHLKSLLENFGGDVGLSLAAYNAGKGAVERSNGIPRYPETVNYVRRITSLYATGGSLYPASLGPVRTPVKAFRDEQGVLNFTNTD